MRHFGMVAGLFLFGFVGVEGAPAKRERATPARTTQAAEASFYDAVGGPMACGGTASGSELVVANRSLRCGTRVRFCYPPSSRRARCATAVVRDRGPYVAGRTWDLAMATAHAIGFPMALGHAMVGYRVLR